MSNSFLLLSAAAMLEKYSALAYPSFVEIMRHPSSLPLYRPLIRLSARSRL